MNVQIRAADRGDAVLIVSFIRKLADYEKLLFEVDCTQEAVVDAFFGDRPHVFCDLAYWNGEPAGFAVWFYNFSTFRGRHGIYVEDLYVEPDHRGKGIGKSLIGHLAGRCRQESLPRLEWRVLNWNSPSIAFYKSLGAVPMADWTVYRMSGLLLNKLGTH